jgi:hypothetical protein
MTGERKSKGLPEVKGSQETAPAPTAVDITLNPQSTHQRGAFNWSLLVKGLAGMGVKPGQMVGLNPFELFKDNPELVHFVRRGLDGIQAPPSTLFEYGRYMESWHMLGAEGILTGIHPGIAQTIVTLGVDLREITVHATLRQALVYCIGRARKPSAASPPAAGGQ